MNSTLWTLVQLFIFLSLAFSSNFNYGFSTTYVNTSVNEFKKYIFKSYEKRNVAITDGKYELIWNIFLNIWFVGFFFGIWLSPVLNERFGRKVGFLFGNFTAFVASVLRCLSIVWYCPELLIISRFITSICMAVTYQSCILFLQECSPTHLRGTFSFFSEMSYSSMCLIGSLLGNDYILGKHLIGLTFFVVPFCFFFLIILFFLPETPKYLLLTRKSEDRASNSVKFYHGKQVDASHVLQAIQMEAELDRTEDATTISKIRDLFAEKHLRLALFLSVSALQNTVGFWSLLLSSTYFLESVNLQEAIAEWSTTAMLLAYVLGSLTGGIIIERFKRRKILLGFTLINNIILILFVFFAEMQRVIDYLKYGCLVSLILYGYTYGTGVGPISWFICSELVPQKYRSATQSTAYAINTIMVVISTFTILPLYDIVGSYAFIILYSIPSALSICILFRWLPETNGREIFEIVTELKGK